MKINLINKRVGVFFILILVGSYLLLNLEDGQMQNSWGADSPAVKEAKEIYASRCALCHGSEGKGDGVAAAGLNPKPKSFIDSKWQKSVTDDYIEKIILKGGAEVGKSNLMPGNADLAGKPEVIKEIRKMIRGMSKK